MKINSGKVHQKLHNFHLQMLKEPNILSNYKQILNSYKEKYNKYRYLMKKNAYNLIGLRIKTSFCKSKAVSF